MTVLTVILTGITRENLVIYKVAAKKAIATFVFASTGILVGGAVVGIKVWETALWTGVGALINFVYRASEEYIKSADADDATPSNNGDLL